MVCLYTSLYIDTCIYILKGRPNRHIKGRPYIDMLKGRPYIDIL